MLDDDDDVEDDDADDDDKAKQWVAGLGAVVNRKWNELESSPLPSHRALDGEVPNGREESNRYPYL